jgi:hypothetical protein
MQVIPHKELGGTGWDTNTGPCLETEVWRGCCDGIFIHANPDATSIVATVTAGSHTSMNH